MSLEKTRDMHIDTDGIVQLKGRAICLIDTGDELLVTELMFYGSFNNLDHQQVVVQAVHG